MSKLGQIKSDEELPAGGGTAASTVSDLDGSASAGIATTFARGDHKHGDSARHAAHSDDQTLQSLGAVATNDSRLSDARTPLTHAHAPGDVTGTAVVTADSRLSDARTPIAHSHAPSDVTGTAVVTADSRLSDARTPTAHIQAESTITFTDITTGNAAAGQHGFFPRLPTPTGKYLKDDMTWAAVTATPPDIAQTLRLPTTDETIAANMSALIVGDYEIPSGYVLDILGNAVFCIL